MAISFLHLNSPKTEAVLFTPSGSDVERPAEEAGIPFSVRLSPNWDLSIEIAPVD